MVGWRLEKCTMIPDCILKTLYVYVIRYNNEKRVSLIVCNPSVKFIIIYKL